MEDYVKHIRQTAKGSESESWCGEHITDWAFVNIDHATYNALNSGRLVACQKCIERIMKIFSDHE